jgi:hypothetical protein
MTFENSQLVETWGTQRDAVISPVTNTHFPGSAANMTISIKFNDDAQGFIYKFTITIRCIFIKTKRSKTTVKITPDV